MSNVELELIEEYVYAGQHRFRFKVKNTNIILNVAADNLDEGVKKVIEIVNKLGLLEESM
ncbi:MAG: hypothetical protein J7J20_00935 [Desulfurococcales archaeon]|nr:hypothetical protein [Desulfurococcales archaeon]